MIKCFQQNIFDLLQVKTAALIGGVAVAGIGIAALGAALLSLLKEDDEDEKRHHKWQHWDSSDYDLNCMNKLLLHTLLENPWLL